MTTYSIVSSGNKRIVTIYGETVTFNEETYQKFRTSILNNTQRGSFLLVSCGVVLRSSDVSNLKKLMKQKRYS